MSTEHLRELTKLQQELSQVYGCKAANEMHIARLHEEIARATQKWQESLRGGSAAKGGEV